MSKRNSDEMKRGGTTAYGVSVENPKKVSVLQSCQVTTKKPKLAFSIAKKTPLQSHREDMAPKPVKGSLREAFNSDTEEEEEMPKEARMKMRNFGRDTPTSAGPNSFGKTKQGFCDAKKVFEKQLRAAAEELGD